MRDMESQPYSDDEMRVAKFFYEKGMGGGDDPIGSLMACYNQLVVERKLDQDKLARIRRVVMP